MTYPARNRPLRSNEMYQAPPPAWSLLDLEQWLGKNVSDPDVRKWYRQQKANTVTSADSI